ncbi:MAG: hypothetical protein IVW53_04755 [Chloroflexi bacterium]|nr:hypothetical protein [Chloroflexota bacterium]
MGGGGAAILALDLGTTELKAGLITTDGRLLAAARAGYPLDVDAARGRAEEDPSTWWSALESVVGEVLATAPGGLPGGSTAAIEVAAICVVGQGPTLVAVAEDGTATHSAITWLDGRSSAEAGQLASATGRSGWGLGIAPAALWLERQEPAAADRTRWYLNTWEWAACRLSGVAAATVSLGQEPIDRDRVATEGLHSERLPPIVPAGMIVGGLLRDVAERLGLRPGLPVVAGTVDSFASFHGAGLVDPGQAIDTGGTSGGFAVYWDAPVEVPATWVAHAPLPDRWFLGGAMTSTGKALDWLGERILGGLPQEQLIVEAAAVAPGAGGLLFLPYLSGERSPLWDPSARGAFIGLTLGHAQAHLTRAVLEAAAFALRHVATPILAAGVRVDQLVVTGGTARGDTWNTIKADVLGVPVAVPEIFDSAVLGAAILGAVAIGAFGTVGDAIGGMVRIARRIEPDPANRAVYDAAFAAYVEAWPAIAPTVRRLRELP